jgi:hypothetical protein
VRAIHSEVSKALADVADEVDKIAKVLREDRIPQLLSQMDHANAARYMANGKKPMFPSIPC